MVRRTRQASPAPAVVAEVPDGHGPEAVALLAAMNRELAASSDAAGLVGAGRLRWSAAEAATLELIADAVDRRADLVTAYRRCDDAKLTLKLSAELRLADAAVARLLKTISTEIPARPSNTSVKASRAARTRWNRTTG